MRMLRVTYVDPWVRSVSTVRKWIATGRMLGHGVHPRGATGKPSEGRPGATGHSTETAIQRV